MMNTRRACASVGAVIAAAFIAAAGCKPDETATASARWTFDDKPSGAIPADWRIAQTNPTEAMATWQTIDDSTAPTGRTAFALTESRNYNGTYNLAIAEKYSYADLELTVKVKALAGKEDQGGGPIWRCQDADNYYICRVNPLENNYRVYNVVDGRRRQLDSATVELVDGRWYTLVVRMVGNKITCSLDSKPMLEATDDAIPQAGCIGLWTKADATTAFDDLSVRPVP
jgi:hypothetical protein